MSAISLKSITGITSITTPAGVDNQLTLHNNNTTEAVKLDIAGNVHVNNHLSIAGVTTTQAFNATTGSFTKTSNNFVLVGSSNAGGAAIVLDGDSNGDGTGADYAYIEHNTSGDLNIVVDNPANAGNIKFFTNTSTERLRITTTGDLSLRSNTQNVFLGLKVDSTAINLTLGSTAGTAPRAYFYGTGNGQSTAGDIFMGTGVGGELRLRSGGAIKLQTNSDNSTIDAFFIHAAGTVAVNTFSPDTTYKLDVAGAGQFTTSTNNQQNDFLTGQLTVRNNQTAQGAFIDFRADSANGTQGVIAKIGGFNIHSGSGYDGLLTFSTRQNANNSMVERLRIAEDGQIRHTAASGDSIYTFKRSDANTTGVLGAINFAASDGHSVASIQARGDGDNEGAHIQFYTTSDAAGDIFNAANIERLRIKSDGVIHVPGKFGLGVSSPTAGDLVSGDSQNNPLIHVKGSGVSATGGEYNLVGRFEAGGDADNTGAMIALNHSNDRGLALIGGRSGGNRSFGAIKSIDNVGRLTNVMAFGGDNGQGVNYLTFYTGNSTSTTERLRIASDGNICVAGPADTPYAPLHVYGENNRGLNAIFGKGFVDNAAYHYDDANILVTGRDVDGNDTGSGIEFNSRNTGNSNWLHGAITLGRDGGLKFVNGGAGTTVGSERFRIASDGVIHVNSPDSASGGRIWGNSSQLYLQSGNGRQTFKVNDAASGVNRTYEITTDGHLKFPAGYGIEFSGGTPNAGSSPTVNSAVFDDYEEGKFIPKFLENATTEASYAWQYGQYVKVAGIVHIRLAFGLNGFNSSGGNFTTAWIGGMPYTHASQWGTSDFAYIELHGYSWASNYGDSGNVNALFLELSQNADKFRIVYGNGKQNVNQSSIGTGQRFAVTFSYPVA